MLKKEKLRNKFCYQQFWREICKSYGPEIKIDLAVKKFSDVSKVNRAKSPLFFPLESLERPRTSRNSTRASILEVFENRGSRIEFRVSSFERLSTYI